MSHFLNSIYRIDPKKKNHINAIKSFNKDVRITHLNGNDISGKNYTCSDLLQIIDLNPDKEASFEITCRSTGSSSTLGVLPSLSSFNELLQKYQIKADSSSDIATISQSIQAYVENCKNSDHLDLGVIPPKLSQVNPIQALAILDTLHQSINLTGAIYLKDINAILFQHEGINYRFNYGISTYIERYDFSFDIDDGFYIKHKENDIIINTLQVYFLEWKKNDYTGKLFPDPISELLLTKQQRQKNNEALYQYQKSERHWRYAKIAVFSLLGALSGLTVLLIPLSLYSMKRVVAEIQAGKAAAKSPLAIHKITISAKEESDIRKTRQKFKAKVEDACMYGSTEVEKLTRTQEMPQESAAKKVKYMTPTKLERHRMFANPTVLENSEQPSNHLKYIGLKKTHEEDLMVKMEITRRQIG